MEDNKYLKSLSELFVMVQSLSIPVAVFSMRIE